MALIGHYPDKEIAEGRHDVSPSSPDAERFLYEARIGDGWLHPVASNYTFVVHLALDEREGYGVYKPQLGEIPLWDFPPGTLHRRECAAYQLSKALGWNLIPPTVRREGEAGEGSLQLFVPHDPDDDFFTLRDTHEDEALRLAVFDMIANNADRKGGHCFIGPDRRVWAVDNGLTFNVEHKLRTVIWDFAGRRIPQPLLDDLTRIAVELDAADAGVTIALSENLDASELDVLRARVRRVLDEPVLPHPRTRRDLPWPWR